MAMIVITGSASGIGAATRAELEREGHHVLGVDLHAAEIVADLASAEGRQEAIAELTACAPRVDGLVIAAGLGPHIDDHTRIVSVNYFAAQAVLDGIRPLLASAPSSAAVLIASNSAVLPIGDDELVSLCLKGDEHGAAKRAQEVGGQQAYAASKRALIRAMRHRAHSTEWLGANIRLNAIAPGAVETPLLEGGLQHPQYGPAIRNFPIPAGRFGRPDEIATVAEFLLSQRSSFMIGSVVFVDGGTDAMLRPDCF